MKRIIDKHRPRHSTRYCWWWMPRPGKNALSQAKVFAQARLTRTYGPDQTG
ncbi:MAG: hypothetical protein R2857_07260 [Vampirovibrionales bacterium]